jgi:hypothetical protein
VRLTLGRNTTPDEITEAARVLVRAYETVGKEEDR